MSMNQILNYVTKIIQIGGNKMGSISKHPEIIAVDHGWSHMKTPTKVFTTGIVENPSPTFFKDVLEYQDKCYNIGGERLEVKNTKVENEDFYLLTLASIAKELEQRGVSEATVYLAAGLPLTRFGEEKKEFIDYLSKNETVDFRYSEKDYHIRIAKVSVFPQCYAAVADMIPTFQRRVVVVDIGSWTVDIMPVVNKKPDDAKCNSLPHGLITCMRDINRASIKQFNIEIDELDMEHYIRYHKISSLPDEAIQLIDQKLKDYAEMICRSLKEHGVNVMTTPIVFVGGGASVMKYYGSHLLPNADYKLDVKANAKGYEMLMKMALKKQGR